ncbi:UNVERIFIED_ORG: aspartyl-tRNA(Asn)/glutamyl-tRNA(Gln) amidotransferase subunit A [Gordonia westfalica J30]
MGRELSIGVDRGLLHGIPSGIKDNIDVAGLPTTNGSVVGIAYPEVDAACVSRLRAAGAVVIGKTVMHEFAYGATGDRSAHGPSRNPHNLTLMTGGSSGGSAAAVASGMVPFTLGTDTGGSVRVPAAFCAVGGYKPAHGSIPTQGVRPLAQSLDHLGVLARSAAEAVTVGQMLTDGSAIPLHDLDHHVEIGWLDPAHLCQVDRDVLVESYAAASSVGNLHPIPPEQVHALLSAAAFHYSIISASEAYANLHATTVGASEHIDPGVLRRLQEGSGHPAWQYIEAQNARRRLRHHIDRLLDHYDILALPAVPFSPPPLDIARESSASSGGVLNRPALTTLTSPFNLTGHPAVVATTPKPRASTLAGVQLVSRFNRPNNLWSFAMKLASTGSA